MELTFVRYVSAESRKAVSDVTEGGYWRCGLRLPFSPRPV